MSLPPPSSPGPASPPPRRGTRRGLGVDPDFAPRSGAHRPRRPLWHDILPIVVVVLAVVALAVAVFQLKDSVLGSGADSSSSGALDPGDEDPGQGNAPTAPRSSGTATSTKGANSTAHSTPSSTPGSTASSTPDSTASSTATSAPVDHSLSFKVLNATSRTGLAAGATTKLTQAGWKATNGGNERRFTSPTTVYYGKSSLAATAKAIAKALGGYRVHQSSTYGSSAVTVVLGDDYTA